jgi:uncharacterized protein (DUF2164 family)
MGVIELSKSRKSNIVNEIITYFETEREEQIGELAAELLLDFFTDKIGIEIYNQALDDARAWFAKKLEDIESDYITLEKVSQ